MSFTYTTGVPNPPNLPAIDVGSMQTNTNSIDSIIKVDHVGFNLAGGGKHNQSTYIQKASKPTVSGTDSIVYAKLVSSISQLFFEDQNGKEYQLTGNLTTSGVIGPPPTFAGNYVFADGLILKWGNSAVSTGVTTINFPLAFPTACFGVLLNINNTGVATNSITTEGYPSTASFTARLNGTGTPNCFWIAIGN